MPKVTLDSRHRTFRALPDQRIEYLVEVSFTIPGRLPHRVLLPEASYREPTPQELAAQPRYEVLPKDPAAVAAERQVIQQEISLLSTTPLSIFTF